MKRQEGNRRRYKRKDFMIVDNYVAAPKNIPIIITF
jgi:hypothetical protein